MKKLFEKYEDKNGDLFNKEQVEKNLRKRLSSTEKAAAMPDAKSVYDRSIVDSALRLVAYGNRKMKKPLLEWNGGDFLEHVKMSGGSNGVIFAALQDYIDGEGREQGIAKAIAKEISKAMETNK